MEEKLVILRGIKVPESFAELYNSLMEGFSITLMRTYIESGEKAMYYLMLGFVSGLFKTYENLMHIDNFLEEIGKYNNMEGKDAVENLSITDKDLYNMAMEDCMKENSNKESN